MDRRVLSAQEVIRASRNFVCVRLMTYESASEAERLKAIFPTRSGELENTVFAILDPTGNETLVRSGRSPLSVFGDDEESPARMAQRMQRIAERFGATTERTTARPLPTVASVRLALNVAACDSLPLVVVGLECSPQLRERLTRLAWEGPLAGSFLCAQASSAADRLLIDAQQPAAVWVIQPDAFGQSGQVLAALEVDLSAEQFESGLTDALASHRVTQKSQRSHIARGLRLGVQWDTVLRITDSHGQR